MTEEIVDWLAASQALALLQSKGRLEATMACRTICARANDGLIRARALRFIHGREAADNIDVPRSLWWARGGSALTQNWAAGDFETWIDHRIHMKAYGVTFARTDIEQLIPGRPTAEEPKSQPSIPPSTAKGGRPPADWWEDLLIDLCFRQFRGELQPKTQADVGQAMQEWIAKRGYDAADSTVRKRARKLWDAIKRDAEN
jgi:hypothetical protein